MHIEFLWVNPLESGYLEDREVDGTLTLKCIFRKYVVRMGVAEDRVHYKRCYREWT
jgi:hypothetical protein